MIKTIVLAALMAVPFFAKAQTFAGITAEQNAQNTPAVGLQSTYLSCLLSLRQIRLTSRIMAPLHLLQIIPRLSRKLLMQFLLLAVWS